MWKAAYVMQSAKNITLVIHCIIVMVASSSTSMFSGHDPWRGVLHSTGPRPGSYSPTFDNKLANFTSISGRAGD
jgi:hypothetical protein